MTKTPLRIGLVSYSNMLPFLWSLEKLQEQNVSLKISKYTPAELAERFKNQEFDLCILPLAEIDKNDLLNPLSSFGIAGDGKVETVALFSHQDLDKIETIYLDSESRTSNLLMKVLAKNYLKKEYHFSKEKKSLSDLKVSEAMIAIGDKAWSNTLPIKHDLSEMWKKFTGFPFVFALWVASPNCDDEILKKIAQQFTEDIAQLSSALNNKPDLTPSKKKYLGEIIRYQIDEKMRISMNKFQTFCHTLLENNEG